MATSVEQVEEVRAAVQLYVDACAAADTEALRSALHPRWTMYGVDSESTDIASDVDDFVGWVGAHEPPVGYDATISEIHLAGRAAVATLVESNYYGIDYVIYFTLVRYDDKWTITTKTFGEVPQLAT